MAPECDSEPTVFTLRKVIALPDIIEAIEFHHHVMDRILAGMGKSDAVVTLIDVKEVGRIRPQEIIADTEAEYVPIEGYHLFQPLDMQHNVAKSERTGAKAGNVTPRLERLGRDLGT